MSEFSEKTETSIVCDGFGFVTASEALEAYRGGLITKDEARAFFGLAPALRLSAERVSVSEVNGEKPYSKANS